jgi:hypothetical protein
VSGAFFSREILRLTHGWSAEPAFAAQHAETDTGGAVGGFSSSLPVLVMRSGA